MTTRATESLVSDAGPTSDDARGARAASDVASSSPQSITPVADLGLRAAYVGTQEPERQLSLWCDGLGWSPVIEGEISATMATRLYGVDKSVRVWGLAAPGASRGMVYLLHLPDLPGSAVRRSMTEIGPHSLDIGLTDYARGEAQLKAAGWNFAETPRAMNVDIKTESYPVVEAFIHAPDGVHVQIVQSPTVEMTQAWAQSKDVVFTEMISVLMTAADVDAEADFWATQGFKKWFDIDIADDTINHFLGVPSGTSEHIIFMQGTTTARAELIGMPKDLVVTVPPRHPGRTLGVSGVSLPVPDLNLSAAALAPYMIATTRPVEVDTPLHGQALVCQVVTPNGVVVELVQAV